MCIWVTSRIQGISTQMRSHLLLCVHTYIDTQLDCLSKLGKYNCCRNATHLYTPQVIIQRHTFAWEIHFFILLFARFVNNSFKNRVRTCQSCLWSERINSVERLAPEFFLTTGKKISKFKSKWQWVVCRSENFWNW